MKTVSKLVAYALCALLLLSCVSAFANATGPVTIRDMRHNILSPDSKGNTGNVGMKVGGTLSINLCDEYGTILRTEFITVESDNPGVVAYENDRLVAKSEGTALITVTYTRGGVTYTQTLEINVLGVYQEEEYSDGGPSEVIEPDVPEYP